MKRISTTLLFIAVFSLNVSAQIPINHTYANTDGPDKNPMKGWNSGWWNDYDFASVGFQYIGWKDFEPSDSSFNFNAVENIINRPGSAGRHVILRLYADWHGDTVVSNAGPDWLYTTYGVQRLQAPNGRYITDYNNPNYIDQAIEAIEALAAQYENDPRIYAIQLGVLGYWGEWHDYGFNDNNFDIALSTKTQILDAYTSNFLNKKLMGRYPWQVPLSTDSTIGYHNDFFKPNNNHSNEFDTTIAAGAKWINGPIGGEVPPIDSIDYQQFMIDLYETSAGMGMIETGHYSTMQVGGDKRPCAIDSTGLGCSGFMAMHRKMGYNFQIEFARFAETLSATDSLDVELSLRNTGVAPMYYNWQVQFALLDFNDQPLEILDVPYDLNSILPDSMSYSVSAAMPLNNVPVDEYKLAVRIIQPDADEQKPNPWGLEARNTYVLFSNDVSSVLGSWDNNNALAGGWSILDTISIDSAVVVANSQPLSKDGVRIYPNPSSDHLKIVFNEPVLLNDMQIYDMTGRLVQSIRLENMTQAETLNIANLPSGVYSLVLKSNYKRVQTVFIKKWK